MQHHSGNKSFTLIKSGLKNRTNDKCLLIVKNIIQLNNNNNSPKFLSVRISQTRDLRRTSQIMIKTDFNNNEMK